MVRTFILSMLSLAALTACKNSGQKFDATGTFEATEVIVSSEISGKILLLNINEGDTVSANKTVGVVDAEGISLQKEQVEASISSLNEKTADVSPQVKLLQDQLAVQQSQLNNLLHEQKRIEKLVAQDAATGKQLDDINAQIDVVKKQMNVTKQQIAVQQSNVSTQNRAVLSESKPLQKRVAQLDDQLKRANIINPINGTILTKYAEAGELTSTGKALYKIADLSTLKLRAYVTGDQLSQIKLGQKVKVMRKYHRGDR